MTSNQLTFQVNHNFFGLKDEKKEGNKLGGLNKHVDD
jgi:hypothetical protein